MATTLTSSPVFPAAGETVTLTATGAVGEVVVFEITSIPTDSTVTLGFILTGLDIESSAEVGNSAQGVADREVNGTQFVPDVAGDYDIRIWEFRQFPGYAGCFLGDPVSDGRLELLGATDTTLKVGEPLDLPVISKLGDGGTVRLVVVDDTVRTATIIDAATELGRLAALDAPVVAALAALVGVLASSVGTDLQTGVNDLRANYEAHRVDAAHQGAFTDTDNTVDTTDADSNIGSIDLLNEIREELIDHLTKANTDFPGAAWHTEDDLLNLPLVADATDIRTATVLSADLRERVYERHRILTASPIAHDTADVTNTLAAPSLLDTTIVAYLDAIAEAAPTAPTGESQGVQDLISRFGFDKPQTTT
jgi:hypothetical protein